MDRLKFFQLIGEFCVEFEELCYIMESCVNSILERSGLDGFDKIELRNIILDSKTAEPLQKMLRAMFAYEFDRISDEWVLENKNKILSSIFNDITKLIESRNIIIHTKWNPPIDDEIYMVNDGNVRGRKIKANSKGDATIYPKSNEIELIELIKKCQNMGKAIISIEMSICHKGGFDSNLSCYIKK